MQNKPLIYFIINPHSGKGKSEGLAELITAAARGLDADVRIIITKGPGDIRALAAEGVRAGAVAIAVAGGDGSVHEAIQSLVNSDTALGVIPMGSGNGFANHFRIPRDKKKAIEGILQHRTSTIDTLKINDIICASTAGFGFDAHIAHLFSSYGKRGFSSYVKLVMREFNRYKEQSFTLEIDGKSKTFSAFLLSIANTSEFGNHAYIAPLADAQDGLMDIGILKRIPWHLIPINTYRLFNKAMHRSACFETTQAKSISILLDEPTPMHIDGEAYVLSGRVHIDNLTSSLKIIPGKSFLK